MSPILIVILLLIIGYKFYKFITCVPPNSPPCIPRIPFAGSYWHLLWGNYQYPHKTIRYYADKLKSKVLTCYLGPFYCVVANDYKSIKEIYVKEEFSGRLTEVDILKARAFGKTLGIFFTEGLFWQQQRRFALRNTRDFGFGRRQDKYERDMMEEVKLLIDMLKDGPINDHEKTFLKKGQAYFPDILFPYSANSIWNIMFGDRFDRCEHHKTRFLCESAMLFQRAGDTSGGAIFQRPFLKYFGNMFGYTDILKNHYRMVDFIKEYVEMEKDSHSIDRDRGMVDRYLTEMKQRSEMSNFTDEQLIMTLVDFMFPSLSAMPSAIVHCLKSVMHNSKVTKKIQDEIDRVVGTGRLVNWDDRKNLPYTEATIRESFRYETLTPFGILHKSLRDGTLCGYNIPKNTVLIANLSGMHSDPDLWGDPENFRPERFLKEDGGLGKDFTFPFGFGQRVCAGETFARYNIFEAFAALMQNFNFSFVEGEPTGLDDKLPGLIVTPKETWIRFEPRR
ncbi:PREDICTED: probable cytochrome P450 304a1 [Dufourea novaeangliae]|uniref:probable cytochrome P450 304a1 n=1 Tax=Dufourea novaeangliae TaxID=178035 RepID=UPI0007675560|nr:PREDICTED: probable cytochrome P450 304a1 [Dufourea novaeangliae]